MEMADESETCECLVSILSMVVPLKFLEKYALYHWHERSTAAHSHKRRDTRAQPLCYLNTCGCVNLQENEGVPGFE